MRAVTFLFVLALLVLLAAPAGARDWNVLPGGGGDAPTIQAAVDSASTDDVVRLGDGVFIGPGNFDVSFLGKRITVTSANGPASTTIDCDDEGRAFRFENAETEMSVLSNVRIVRGFAPGGDGGAIYVFNCSPTITGCVIDSSAATNGGAIHVEAPSAGALAVIRSNDIYACEATVGGGAISVKNSRPIIEQNDIHGNRASSGGAIFVTDANSGPQIVGNTIRDNTATQAGGGIRTQATAGGLIVTGNVIRGNTASNGGGMSMQLTDGTVANNTITENVGTGAGSGLHFSNTSNTVERTIIAFNTGAGAISCSNASPSLLCCLVWNPLVSNTFLCGSALQVTADPWFCGAPLPARDFRVRSNSPAVLNTPCGVLIGALDVGCGTSSVDPANWGQLKAMYR